MIVAEFFVVNFLLMTSVIAMETSSKDYDVTADNPSLPALERGLLVETMAENANSSENLTGRVGRRLFRRNLKKRPEMKVLVDFYRKAKKFCKCGIVKFAVAQRKVRK